jgi:hypothetical protein
MLNGIINYQKVRAQKATTMSQSIGGSSFVPRCSKDWLEIEMLKESLRRWDEEMRQRDKEMRRWNEAMRQWDDFYASAFAQQQTILQVSSLNYFIRYRTLSYIFKTKIALQHV